MSQFSPLSPSQCEFIQWTALHWTVWPLVIGVTTGGYLWLILSFRPWGHGLTIGQAAFPPKSVNCHQVVVWMASSVCHK